MYSINYLKINCKMRQKIKKLPTYFNLGALVLDIGSPAPLGHHARQLAAVQRVRDGEQRHGRAFVLHTAVPAHRNKYTLRFQISRDRIPSLKIRKKNVPCKSVATIHRSGSVFCKHRYAYIKINICFPKLSNS